MAEKKNKNTIKNIYQQRKEECYESVRKVMAVFIANEEVLLET